MLCEQINPQLIDYAEGGLSASVRNQVETHMNACTVCQNDFAAMNEWRTMAANWHDEVPPAWQIPALDRPSRLENFAASFRQWFPTIASATALVLVTVLYVQAPGVNSGTLPTNQAADYESLPQLPTATQAAFDSALADNRQQRQQELSRVLELLTAEMNRRSLETEESLRFIISSQIEERKELDQLYQQLEALLETERSAPGSSTRSGGDGSIGNPGSSGATLNPNDAAVGVYQ